MKCKPHLAVASVIIMQLAVERKQSPKATLIRPVPKKNHDPELTGQGYRSVRVLSIWNEIEGELAKTDLSPFIT